MPTVCSLIGNIAIWNGTGTTLGRRRPLPAHTISRADSTKIDPTGKSLLFIGIDVKPRAKKHFCFTETQTSLYQPHPVPFRGASRNVPARGGVRWTRMVRLTRAPEADGEIVWFRHPNGWCQVRKLWALRATVAKVQGSPGRARIIRKPLRGECRVIPV